MTLRYCGVKQMGNENEWLENLKPIPISDYLDRTVQEFPDRPAIDFFGNKINYRELGELVNRAATGFQKLGVKKGDHIGLCLPNIPYYTICYFAILKVGAVVVNYNPLYTENELTKQIEDSHTKLMVTLDLKQIYDKFEPILQSDKLDKVIVCPFTQALPWLKKTLFNLFKSKELTSISFDSKRLPYSILMEGGNAPEPVEIDPEQDIALLQYTGGTTGVPKGAMLSHRNLSANVEQIRHTFKGGVEPGAERIVCVLPFFHVFAMTAGQNFSVAIGTEMTLVPRFELEPVLKTIAKKKATLFLGVPTIFTAINNSPSIDKYDLSCLKYCISGGAPLPVEVKEKFEKITGCYLAEGYGLTESSPLVAVNPIDGTALAGSIGKIVAGTTIKFCPLDDDSDEAQKISEQDRLKPLPLGEKGELCVKGPQVMVGYWNRPEETANSIKEGYLHTGDVGYQDENGYVFLVDRIKDLILCSGYNVYPRVIEEALYLHSDVEEAIVIGISDEYRGQKPKAFVKKHEGSTMTAEILLTFLKEHLNPIEMPAEIEFRDELPKTMIGKLSKKELVEEEQQKLANANKS